MIRASAKRQTRRRTGIATGCAVAATVAVVAVIASGVTNIGQDRSDGIGPIGTPSSSPPPSTATSGPMDTTTWAPYTSARYSSDLESLVGHPPDWTVVPATREWRFDTDAADPLSPAHESFVDPTGNVRVSIWEVPLDSVAASSECTDLQGRPYRMCVETATTSWPGSMTTARQSGVTTPCGGIEDRGVELCLEKMDCHPGLLVPFESAVLAFFNGGIYNADAMTVVAVWRGESDPSVAPYGGAQRLLEGFLSTMQVWPASTPRAERTMGMENDIKEELLR